jgi:uncharacterized membrane protein
MDPIVYIMNIEDRDYIIKALTDDFKVEIVSIIKSKRRLYKAYAISEYFSQIFLILTAILSYANGYFSYTWMSLIAGGCATFVYACGKFSKYCLDEHNEREATIKNSIKTVGIENGPEILVSSNDAVNV